MGSGSSNLDQSDCCSNCDLQLTRAARRSKRVCLECRACMCVGCLRTTTAGSGAGSTPISLRFSRIPKRVTTGYCLSCAVMLASNPTDQQLIQLKVKHLKGFLVRRNVPEVSGCVEKRELVELILAQVGSQSYRERVELEESRLEELLQAQQAHQAQQAQQAQATSQQQEQQPTRMEETTEEQTAASPETTDSTGNCDTPVSSQPDVDSPQADSRVHPADVASSAPSVEETPRVNETQAGDNSSEFSIPSQAGTEVKQSSETLSKISLSEIESVSEVDTLSVKQLKIILTRNLVTYRGCKEKHELINKVKMLWQSRQDNERLYQQLLNPPATEDGVPASREEPELCKICMDSAIDCVLLDCGHMVTCTKCGKQMNECPICRQFVIRAVHIFRA